MILSGGPDSVYENNSPKVHKSLFDKGIPVLGICYGHQLMAHTLGGVVRPGKLKEYGIASVKVKVLNGDALFEGLTKNQTVWMSHGDEIQALPHGFRVLASNRNCRFSAVADPERKLYGLQFHPEVSHTIHGQSILSNFLFNICAIREKNWRPKEQVELLSKISEIRRRAGK